MYPHENAKQSRHYPSIRAVLMMAVCTAMIPPSAIIVLGGFEHGAQFAEQVRAEAVRQADAFAEIQIVTTESTRQLLQTLASLPAFKNGNLAEMTDTLKSVHESNSDYVNLTTVDDRGVVDASSMLAAGVDLSQRRHVRSSLLERRFVAGDYFLNLVDSQPSFAFSAPIFDNAGTLRGSISATIRLDAYRRLFNRLKLPDNANLRLLDRNGVRLYVYPEAATTPIGMPIKSSVWNRILEGGEQGTFEDLGSDDIPRIFAFRSLSLEGSNEPYMYVVYATPKAYVVAGTRSRLFRNILLMIGVTGFSLLCAALFSQKFFKTET